jgi:hypothetical protein
MLSPLFSLSLSLSLSHACDAQNAIPEFVSENAKGEYPGQALQGALIFGNTNQIEGGDDDIFGGTFATTTTT